VAKMAAESSPAEMGFAHRKVCVSLVVLVAFADGT
jgi:hypothetical protein